MKSTYSDNFRHKIVLIPPVLGKKTKSKAVTITLGLADTKSEAIRYLADAERRYASRPGRIMIVSPKAA